MKAITKISATLGVTVMLASCASNYDVAQVSGMKDQGGAFASALHKRYIERAEFEVNEGDWASVGFFNTRAEMSAMGDVPAVQSANERNLKVDVNDINRAYNALTSALKTSAPQVTPDACARAQTWFEHWMEQAAEGHQPDHISAARSGFDTAMPECKGDMPMVKPMVKPMSNAMSASFIVYFDHNSAELTPSANVIVGLAAGVGMDAYASRAVLVGHTDTSGASAYNNALSQKRAQAVAAALLAKGMPAAEVRSSHAGETDLKVETGDNVREGQNRRVVIMFER